MGKKRRRLAATLEATFELEQAEVMRAVYGAAPAAAVAARTLGMFS